MSTGQAELLERDPKVARALVRLYQEKAPGPALEEAEKLVRAGLAVVTVPAIGAIKLTPDGQRWAAELLGGVA